MNISPWKSMKHTATKRINITYIFMLFLTLITMSQYLSAQNNFVNEATWVTNGTVYAIHCTTDTIYIGGDFDYVLPNTKSGASINSLTGLVRHAFPPINHIVYASIPDGFGGWYIGGGFTKVGRHTRNYLAHILADGTVASDWDPDASGEVRALAKSGSTIYVGGSFATIGGQDRANIAAVDATTGAVLDWNPSSDDPVTVLAIDGSIIYVGGWFSNIGGADRNRLAALDLATGLATPWNPDSNSNGPTTSMVLFNNLVYVGGGFSNIGGQPRNRIAALDPATGMATSWDPNITGGSVNGMVVMDSTVYAGGTFTSVGGNPRNKIAAIDRATGLMTDWNPNPSRGNSTATVYAMASYGTTVYAGGYFNEIGGQPRINLAALDTTTTGSATAWNPYADNIVYSLSATDSTVYAGGLFTSIGKQERQNIAAIDVKTGMATPWNPKATGGSTVEIHALATSGTVVYAGGRFTAIGGQDRSCIAALDAATGLATDWNPGASNSSGFTEVAGLAVDNSVIYALGRFSTIGGQPRKYLAALDSATSQATTWNPNASGNKISAPSTPGVPFAVNGLKIYTEAPVLAESRIVAFDINTGEASYYGPSSVVLYGSPNALVVKESIIYEGGLKLVNQLNQAFVRAIDLSTGAIIWERVEIRTDSSGLIWSIAASDTTVFAGGAFDNFSGVPRNNIAAFDADTGQILDWDPNSDNVINVINVTEKSVFAGGPFTNIGGENYSKFVQFDFQPLSDEISGTGYLFW